MKSEEAIPRLRFPEFHNAPAWEEKKLGHICESFSGGTPLTNKKEYYGGDIPFIRSAEIGAEKTDLFLTQEGLENSAAKIIKKGEVLYALYGANSGDIALAKQEGAINQAILCLRNSQNSEFLYYSLLHEKSAIISKYIQGGQGNLSGEIIRSILLNFPSLAERQRIADCLSSLDGLIEATSQKAEQLKEYKKGLMQKLFPQEGENIPRLRFPEFKNAPAWEEKKLGEMSHPRQWPTLSNQDLVENGDYPVFGANGLIGRYSGYNHKDEVIAVTCRGATCGNVLIIPPESYVTGNAMCLDDLNKGVCTLPYLYYFLSYQGFQKIVSGSAQPQIINKDISIFPILLPSLPEQKKIADCLSSLDELIEATSQKVEQLKEYKKGLMQKLFPLM